MEPIVPEMDILRYLKVTMKSTSIIVMICKWGIILAADGMGFSLKEMLKVLLGAESPDEGNLQQDEWFENFEKFKEIYDFSEKEIENVYESVAERKKYNVVETDAVKVRKIGKAGHILMAASGISMLNHDIWTRLSLMADEYYELHGRLMPVGVCTVFCKKYLNGKFEAADWDLAEEYDMSDFADSAIVFATYENISTANPRPKVVYVDKNEKDDIYPLECVGQGRVLASKVLFEQCSFDMEKEIAKSIVREALQVASFGLLSGGIITIAIIDNNHTVEMYRGSVEFTTGSLPLAPLVPYEPPEYDLHLRRASLDPGSLPIKEDEKRRRIL